MPEYHIYSCYSCGQFQVQQKKKSNKWQCRICHSKQSVKKVYGKAHRAKDLRPLCQELSMNRGMQQEATNAATLEREERKQNEPRPVPTQNQSTSTKPKAPKINKWSKYIEKKPQVKEKEVLPEDDSFVTMLPDDVSIINKNKSRWNKKGQKRTRTTQPRVAKKQKVMPKSKPPYSKPTSSNNYKTQTAPIRAPIRAPPVASNSRYTTQRPLTKPKPQVTKTVTKTGAWKNFKAPVKVKPPAPIEKPKIPVASKANNSWMQFVEEPEEPEKPLDVDAIEDGGVFGSFMDLAEGDGKEESEIALVMSLPDGP